MAQFQAGQKLTAADLNNAFQGVAGVQNPTSDMKWYGTPMGRLQAAWSVFSNRRDMAPRPLDIAVAVDPVDEPFSLPAGEESSVQAHGVRRVFMNLGGSGQGFRGLVTKPPYFYENCPNIGSFNHSPWLAVLGWQTPDQEAPWGRGEQPVYSLWYNAFNQPQQDTPEQWTAVQKLYQDDVCRNCSKDNWWYTGITLERSDPDVFKNLGVGWLADIVAYPLFARVKFDGGDYTDQETVFPILCISTQADYAVRARLMDEDFRQGLVEKIENEIGRYWGFEVEDVFFLEDPELVKTLATFDWSGQTLDACYRQTSNEAVFRKREDGGNKFKEFWGVRAQAYKPDLFNYVNREGEHKSYKLDVLLCHSPGGGGQYVPKQFEPTAVGAAYARLDGKDYFIPRYCPVAWTECLSSDDPVSACLSAMFADLLSGSLSSSVQTRLIAVNQPGAQGWRYYDTCPDFSEGDAKPDSSVSSLVLSSLQQLSGGEWSLFEFENLSNQIQMPSLTSQTLRDEFVVREWYDGAVKPAVVRYLPVSSMVSAVSSLISANVPDADVPAAGLSSLQTRTLDGGSKVLELYNFHDPAVETVYLSAQSRYDFIVRDNQDNCVKYADLSGIGGEVTLSGTDGSSSKGSEWKFQSASNSNISVNINANGVIELACYYV